MALSFDETLSSDLSAFVRRDRDGAASLDLLVSGARCAACLGKIENEVRKLPGVVSARLNLSTGRLAIGLRDAGVDPGRISAALAALGYPSAPFDPARVRAERDQEGRRLIIALAVAGFGVMNTMMFSVPIWAGLFDQELGPATRSLMMWMSAIVGAPCALYAGLPFFGSAWRSLRSRRANMDVPISVGVILTLAISFSETVMGGRDAYFDAAVSLLFLLLIGRWLDHVLRTGARSAAGDLLALQAPTAAVVGPDGRERAMPLDSVRPGDVLRVRPGDRVPVDAVLEEGEAVLDTSLLTGETLPVRLAPGGLVRSGSINLAGLLHLRAQARSEDSALAAIARLVDVGAQSRSRYVRLADRAAALYVPIVHLAALATFVGGWAVGLGLREAVIRAVAVLIVTCPCALGLAVPAVQIVASARLFRKGVLVKSGAALERLAEVDHVVFDKTGVLTEGRPVLVGGAPHHVAQAALLARGSRHPLARAVSRAAGDGPVGEGLVEVAGEGVEALIDGVRWRLGSAAFVGAPRAGRGEMELWFGPVSGPQVRLTFVDGVRSDAAATVADLKARGLSVEILSGDREASVAAVADAVGIETWRAEMSPQAKTEAVRSRAGGRKVLMVGDGLNDAAALAGAHAAISPGTALEAAQNAADMILTAPGLAALTEALDIARAARRRALENFAFAALYNVVAAPAAMLGLINPFVAALAMSGSSLVVMLNAIRVGRGR